MTGWRKWSLGMVYIVGGLLLLAGALLTDKTGTVIGALAGAFVSLATGMGVIVYGNVMEHRARGSKDAKET